MKQFIYFISGPTAIGKSSIALRVAKKINGMVINADSMQIYSNLEILTARPSKKDHDEIEHRLYGYINGSERYNVAKWCKDVVKIIHESNKKQIPLIIVGGTGMYINALLNGIINLPSIPEYYKKESENLLKKEGRENFIKIISEFDSDSLKDISNNDSTRLKRIWEVYKSSGIAFSKWKKNKNKKFINDLFYKIYLFAPPRDRIYLNVNNRFKKMIKEGALQEVKKLCDLKLDPTLPIMRAHGVPEISNYLQNYCTLEECINKGQQVTRNYVKRQLTWWRSSRLPIHIVFDQFPNEIDEKLIII